MGTVSSACQSCFDNRDNKPDLFQPTLDLMSKQINSRTRESTYDDLDRVIDKSFKTQQADDCTSLDEVDGNQHNAITKRKYQRLSLEDFNVIKVIGKGSMGKIYLVQKKENKKHYALRVMKKKDLVLKNLLKCVLNEKSILQDLKHPFIVSLRSSFQTNTKAYLITDYCSGGNLGTLMDRVGKFDEKAAKFYIAELVLALEYLHEKLNIIHRGLKSENILISAEGHIKISDFGLAKASTQALTLCGTQEYLAPEIIWGRAYGHAIDWWALGCLMYQMLTGKTPFHAENREKLFNDIMAKDPRMEPKFSGSLKNLLLKLLTKNPKQRLGSQGAWEVKNHYFFSDVDWTAVLNKDLAPPYKVDAPKQELEPVLNYNGFDDNSGVDTPVNGSDTTSVYNLNFPRFSYVGRETVALSNATETQVEQAERL